MYVYLLIFIAMLWGWGIICIKIVLQEINVMTFVLLRFGITSLCMMIALPLNVKSKANSFRDITRGINLGIFMTGSICSHIISIDILSPSLASFLSGLPVFFMLFINFFKLKKLPKIMDLLITLICVIGLALVTHGTGITWGIGVFYGLTSSFFFALHTFYVSRYTKDSNLYILTLVQFIIPTLLAACVLFFSTKTFSVPLKMISWSALLFCVFFNTLAIKLQMYCQRYVSPFKVSVIFLLEPVFVTFFSFLYFHEQLYISFYAGALLILLSILLINSRLRNM